MDLGGRSLFRVSKASWQPTAPSLTGGLVWGLRQGFLVVRLAFGTLACLAWAASDLWVPAHPVRAPRAVVVVVVVVVVEHWADFAARGALVADQTDSGGLA